jgi:NAD(P)-dependent dehydrogenase (short-subunit alcohol dehydrogenase family)
MKGMNLDFSGKVAVVTGGSRGLGMGIAMALLENGAQVATCGRKQENLDTATEVFGAKGYHVMALAANVGQADHMERFFQAVDERFGRLDILVNNAGMNILTASVAEADEGLWDKIIQTNLKGTFLASREAVKLMKRGGGGKIVNITSTAAKKAAPGMGIYCVAKAAVEMLTRVMGTELAQHRIAVNSVAPAMVRTKFSRPFWNDEGLLKQITAAIPVGRIAEVEDVIGTVLFLASGLADFVTGESVTVDGGSMA